MSKKIHLHHLFFIRNAVVVVLITFSINSFSQENSYTNYDVKDGLAASVVYRMTQDKEGFLWFGTETGLSRFDGSKFVNFSIKDGLPDNEILNVFADSRGRVWLSPFKPSVSYVYNGKIHNQMNDSLLAKIRPTSVLISIVEDSLGNILLMERAFLHLIKKDGSVKTINVKREEGKGMFYAVCGLSEGGFLVNMNRGIYKLKNDSLHFISSTPHTWFFYSSPTNAISERKFVFPVYYLESKVLDLSDRHIAQIEKPASLLNTFLWGDTAIISCTKKGVIVKFLTLPERPSKRYLEKEAISHLFKDNEGNLWFCSMGNGVFKLNSEAIKSIVLKSKRADRPSGVKSLVVDGSSLVLGSEVEAIYRVTILKDTTHIIEWNTVFSDGLSEVYDVLVLPDHSIVFGTGSNIFHMSPTFKVLNRSETVSTKKLFLEKGDSTMIVARSDGAFRYKIGNFKITDTLYRKRTTSICALGSDIFIGTLEGLIRRNSSGQIHQFGQYYPSLAGRILSICAGDKGDLWVGTAGYGVVGIRGDSVIASFTTENGVTSNICKTVAFRDGFLWVGTDKGVCKISTRDFKQIVKYTTTDGLLSNSINTLLLTDSLVFIGSSKGLSFFDEKYVSRLSFCNLKFTRISISDSTIDVYNKSNTIFPNSTSNLQFEFVGISYRSGGDMRYRYRLLGIDTAWQEINQNVLNFPRLPGGTYSLQVQAINKFGIRSKIEEFNFEIAKRFWQKTWFQLLAAVCIGIGLYIAFRIVDNRTRAKEAEKAEIARKIAELEQLALKSQMNPHFIFNSLNSIQHYVMNKDIAGANKFISDFSRLIRSTLDYSSKSTIPLMDEVAYLKTYLELEKTRLENKFKFEISVMPSIEEGDYLIPPMLLQPYVENSIRHGIRFREDENGLVRLIFSTEENYVVCVIEDNGVGRKTAGQYKMTSPIEYQSKGMSLTESRVSYINRHLNTKVYVLIEDLVDQNLQALGTRVTLRIPDTLS